jgi:hypothetical protein
MRQNRDGCYHEPQNASPHRGGRLARPWSAPPWPPRLVHSNAWRPDLLLGHSDLISLIPGYLVGLIQGPIREKLVEIHILIYLHLHHVLILELLW